MPNPSPTSVATASDLNNLLPVANGTISIDGQSLPNNLIGEVLSGFNGGLALQITPTMANTLGANGVTVTGTATFLGVKGTQVAATFLLSGDFTLTVTFPDLSFSTLAKADSKLQLPHGFDVDLGSVVLTVAQAGSSVTLSAAASNASLGQFTLQAQQTSGRWSIAAGFAVQTAGIASLPGMKGSPLASFDSFIGLQNLLLVLSSFDNPSFKSFNAPAVAGSSAITLPPGSGGLQQGFNIFANLVGTNGKQTSHAFQLLASYLKLKPEGMLVALSVSLPDPMKGSQLFLEVNNIAVGNGMIMSGEFGAELAGSTVGLYFQGKAVAPIQNQPVTFTATALAVPTGVVVGGSMQTTSPLTFDIGTTKIGISELGIAIGIDDDGVPSLGFAATFDINKINVSAAIFIDSTNPAQSVFAAALSGFSLLDIATCLAQQAVEVTGGNASARAIPAAFATILSQFTLTGTETFSLPATVAASLDAGDIAAVSKAFANSPNKIAIPSVRSQVLLDVNRKGSLWYLTDLSTRLHYTLSSTVSGGSVSVSLEPQFYWAAQTSYIGGLQFPIGFYVAGSLDLYLLTATIDIKVQPNMGLVAEVDVTPVILINQNFFALTGAKGVAGPHVFICTFTQSSISDPVLRQPHILISGELKILGVDVSSTYFVVSPSGLTFAIQQQTEVWLKLNLNGSFTSSSNMSLGGAITVGIDDSFDLGRLGVIPIVCDATGSLSISLINNVASAHVQLAFGFAGFVVIFGANLDVNVGALASQAALQKLLHTTILNALEGQLLGNVEAWIRWFYGINKSAGMQQIGTALAYSYSMAASTGTTAMQMAGVTVNDIGSALRNGYDLSSAAAATAMHAANLGASDIAGALKSAYGSSDNDAAVAMKAAGIAASDIAKGLQSAYNLSLSDLVGVLKGSLGLGADDLKAILESCGFSLIDILKNL